MDVFIKKEVNSEIKHKTGSWRKFITNVKEAINRSVRLPTDNPVPNMNWYQDSYVKTKSKKNHMFKSMITYDKNSTYDI